VVDDPPGELAKPEPVLAPLAEPNPLACDPVPVVEPVPPAFEVVLPDAEVLPRCKKRFSTISSNFKQRYQRSTKHNTATSRVHWVSNVLYGRTEPQLSVGKIPKEKSRKPS
jgi:hypothetical protein